MLTVQNDEKAFLGNVSWTEKAEQTVLTKNGMVSVASASAQVTHGLVMFSIYTAQNSKAQRIVANS